MIGRHARCGCGSCRLRRLRAISPRTGRVIGTRAVRELDQRDPRIVRLVLMQAAESEMPS